jgi:CDP-diacylglycerol--glycerol-3-phosphate 3-phosphatidyltransferase
MFRFTLATQITLSRMVFAIFAILCLYLPFMYHGFVALGFFLIAIVTDFFDGRVARARNEVSRLGIFLDPLIDKLMVLSVMIALIEFGIFPAVLVILTLFRELIVTSFRDFAGTKGIAIPSVMSGKVKSTLQFIALLIGILAIALGDARISADTDITRLASGVAHASVWVLTASVIAGYYGMWEIFSKNLKRVLQS